MKRTIFAILSVILVIMMTGCAKPPVETPDDDIEVTPPGYDEKLPENDGTENKEDIPYINENGEEALNPNVTEKPVENDPPEYFFAEKPSDYDSYSGKFIKSSLAGKTIEEIKGVWGEGDMNQKGETEGTTAYFTDVHDIIIRYLVINGEILDIEILEN